MKQIVFFIGTEAEFIKVFPVMAELEKRGIGYSIFASGQNDIQKSALFEALNHKGCDLVFSDPGSIRKTAPGLLTWFIKTALRARWELKHRNTIKGANVFWIVHGDTVSTLMGAWLAHSLGVAPAHIEAGLRSFDYLNPFPEEINRTLVSRYARIHFAPGREAEANLKKAKGRVVDTGCNTLIDSLALSVTYGGKPDETPAGSGDYFVFVVHRQENLASKTILARFLDETVRAAERIPCVFVLHEPARAALERFGLLPMLEDANNVRLTGRMGYFDFMRLLAGAAYVVTDGGSNQEELSYMGKPCLLLRKKTERTEGLGKNAILYQGDPGMIGWFSKNYQSYVQNPVVPAVSPSSVIVNVIEDMIREQ